jgi:hypothetical protein
LTPFNTLQSETITFFAKFLFGGESRLYFYNTTFLFWYDVFMDKLFKIGDVVPLTGSYLCVPCGYVQEFVVGEEIKIVEDTGK